MGVFISSVIYLHCFPKYRPMLTYAILGILLGNAFAGVLWEDLEMSYDVIGKRIEKCEKGGSNEFSLVYSRMKMVSPTRRVWDTNFIISKTMDNVTIDVDISTLKEGRWQTNFFFLRLGDLCKGVKNTVPKFFNSFMNHADLKKCPFPAGNYTISNMPLKLDFSIPHMPQGNYKCNLLMKRRGKLIGCFSITVDITPRKKSKS